MWVVPSYILRKQDLHGYDKYYGKKVAHIIRPGFVLQAWISGKKQMHAMEILVSESITHLFLK